MGPQDKLAADTSLPDRKGAGRCATPRDPRAHCSSEPKGHAAGTRPLLDEARGADQSRSAIGQLLRSLPHRNHQLLFYESGPQSRLPTMRD
jgi:hypothetical protein